MRSAMVVVTALTLAVLAFDPAPAPAEAGQGATVQSGKVKVPDGELYYEVQGSGPTVVLLHGGLLDSRMWDDQFGVLAGRFRVVRYDARGHGRSSRITGDYCNYRDLHALLTALGIRKTTLVGLSLGGRTAIDFALVHPEMVEALVAVSTGISGWDFTKDTVLGEHQVGLQKAVEAKDLDLCVEWFQRSWTDGPKRKPADVDPAVRERVRAMARANIGGNSRGTVEEVNAVPRVGEIRVPMLAVLGDLDMASIHGIFDLITTKVPGVRKAVIAGAAHMVNMEKPTEFNRVLLNFLTTSVGTTSTSMPVDPTAEREKIAQVVTSVGVVEKRDGRWVVVQQHFSFASDR